MEVSGTEERMGQWLREATWVEPLLALYLEQPGQFPFIGQ